MYNRSMKVAVRGPAVRPAPDVCKQASSLGRGIAKSSQNLCQISQNAAESAYIDISTETFLLDTFQFIPKSGVRVQNKH